jgi:Tfp pilus assembly protein PilF
MVMTYAVAAGGGEFIKDKQSASPEAILNLQEGMLAYQQRDFAQAVRLLAMGLSLGAEDWNCRLYLGMAYFRVGEVELSRGEFRKIMNGCLDRDLRLRAAAALAATNPNMP